MRVSLVAGPILGQSRRREKGLNSVACNLRERTAVRRGPRRPGLRLREQESLGLQGSPALKDRG